MFVLGWAGWYVLLKHWHKASLYANTNIHRLSTGVVIKRRCAREIIVLRLCQPTRKDCLMCEDYPCCGHTDGLGCDWVSPNEVVPCAVCIDARATRPYHNQVDGCPTLRARAMESVPANTPCQFFGEDSDCEGEQADIVEEGTYFCFTCLEARNAFMREMQEQYDDYGNRF